MSKQLRDENLMITAATELYAAKYGLSTEEAFALFRQNGINLLIRKHYKALHTQPLDESFRFADDIIKRLSK